MLIPPLMMEPGLTQARFEAFCRVWAAIALIVLHTGFKLAPAVLREIMKQPLLIEAHAEAVFHDFALMTVDRSEVMYRIPEIARKARLHCLMILLHRLHLFSSMLRLYPIIS